VCWFEEDNTDGSMETMLTRDVEMVCEQHQQLTDLVHKLHTQNNQLRLLVSPLSTHSHHDDDDDNHISSLSVGDFDLMAAASLGELVELV